AAGPRCVEVARQPFVPCNNNGFGLEATDPAGAAAGALCPVDPADGGCQRGAGIVVGPVALSKDHGAVHSAGYLPADASRGLPGGIENGATRWYFYWTAPP